MLIRLGYCIIILVILDTDDVVKETIEADYICWLKYRMEALKADWLWDIYYSSCDLGTLN